MEDVVHFPRILISETYVNKDFSYKTLHRLDARMSTAICFRQQMLSTTNCVRCEHSTHWSVAVAVVVVVVIDDNNNDNNEDDDDVITALYKGRQPD